MSKIDAYQLSHPELLSDETLCEILRNRCIILPSFETLSREELIEIFKRIALPMPQRRYNKARILGKALNDIRTTRGIKTATCSRKNTDIPEETSPARNSKKGRDEAEDCSAKDRLKTPISEEQQMSKKIRLSNSCHMENLAEKDGKRKNEVSSLPESKKRQKITWP